VAGQLDWDQVIAWRAARHHLDERVPATAMLEVVAGLAGLHAQVMSSAELTLWARVEGLAPGAVQRALWPERSMVRPGPHARHPAPALCGRVPAVAGRPLDPAPVGVRGLAARVRSALAELERLNDLGHFVVGRDHPPGPGPGQQLPLGEALGGHEPGLDEADVDAVAGSSIATASVQPARANLLAE
jgi:hypothetical protein